MPRPADVPRPSNSLHRPLLLIPFLALALVLSALVALPAPTARAAEALTDPIPERPAASGIGLTVEEFASFPKTDPPPGPVTDPRLVRHARINYLSELPDGSGRMAVPDLNGKLYLVEDGKPHVYLDIAATFAPAFFASRGLGQGFGFVTFDPGFKKNGRFYTVHTEAATATTAQPDMRQATNTNFHGIITEWTADDPAADTFSGTRRELLRIGFTGQIHGIQQIDFNPTAQPDDKDYGLLYVAVGDGGQGARNTEPQNLSRPHGKILRIDPRGSDSANGKYGIPAANPFTGTPGALGEIYAYGMRDPHRFSWDPAGSHRMYLGHIGEHAIESVYEVRAGDNLGWSEREGAFVFDKTATDPCARILPLPEDDARYGYTYPVAAYDHDPPAGWNCTSDVGRAIVGGFVYRGQSMPELQGAYIFGDLVDGRLLYAESAKLRRGSGDLAPLYELMVYDESGKRVTMQDLAGDDRVDLRFGRDAEGELYLLSKANGKIWKVTGTRTFASCDTGDTKVADVMGAENWAPVTPAKWRFPGSEVILAEAGAQRPGPRRPFEYAVLTAGPRFGPVRIEGEVRLDTPVEVTNRDVIIVFGHQSDTKFNYAHLSTDNTIYPHNGIFVVNDADRKRIEDQWNGRTGAPPAITDTAWHTVRVVHCPGTGEIAVYVDGSNRPLMTAVDTTLTSGRVGFGSFDNIGRLRELKVTGTPIAE
ncbi:PQQ-dependent sugar dehydrogenase [Streptomyces himalayensis]|uniref:PQQ-dependent sugar dehydrogenase n=1 Tax=Streptomyces himalayensis subsp. himalayensis TaxID=2756131 RepID=A0A7W0I9U4_9ACTN|nr:PQQ-dependent sugar dehydrogenase [Streptomyces himalayensis]MBA2947762.1 PQQ-dependent sugar dehydrogenase [Streptomyces himalayensis subsp. himalayensis]